MTPPEGDASELTPEQLQAAAEALGLEVKAHGRLGAGAMKRVGEALESGELDLAALGVPAAPEAPAAPAAPVIPQAAETPVAPEAPVAPAGPVNVSDLSIEQLRAVAEQLGIEVKAHGRLGGGAQKRVQEALVAGTVSLGGAPAASVAPAAPTAPVAPEAPVAPAKAPARPAASPTAQRAPAQPRPAPRREEDFTRKPVPQVAPVSLEDKREVQAVFTRRTFLNWIFVGWAAFAAATAVFLAAVGRFFFPNVLFEPPLAFKVGFPHEYDVGAVDTRWKAKYGIWIVREPEGFYALATVCTHLGCTPNWLDAEQKYKCPCHGSGFRKSGINFEGPAPRPLERYKIVLAEDGQILVDKGKMFFYEKDEWSHSEAYLSWT